MRKLCLSGLAILLALALAPTAGAEAPPVVTLDSPSALLSLKVMVKAGSAADPEGLEGLANITADALIQGGFGDPENPVTKEELAEITRPWGSGAYPSVRISKEATTFSMTVPKEVLDAYMEEVFTPMFTRPLFASREVERLGAEAVEQLRSLRLEQIELVGLTAVDTVVHNGTSYAHPNLGTENGLKAIGAESVQRFYASYYTPENIVVGVSTADAAIIGKLKAALEDAGQAEAEGLAKQQAKAPAPVKGRAVVILAVPNAISSGLHAAFPLPLTRADKDYWPLYIANVWFGTHRDGFSHLYDVIRDQRGYNYGDYSYIEHFAARPFRQFPPPNTPRRYQYFSIWIRPVGHEYAHHILKAFTWELENFIRSGLSEQQCALAKNKARVLYLSLAETTDRLLSYRLDDDFYGLDRGYLEGYLENVNEVACTEVNKAIRKYLQAENLKYVVVTDDEVAPKLAEAIATGGPAWGKAPADYQIDVKTEGDQKSYEVPEAKLDLLRRDAAWAHYWLDIPRERIHIVPIEKMFMTATVPE
jgi:zinc protease